MHIINICILGSSVEHGDHINNMSKFVNIFSPISLRVSSAKQNSIKGDVIIEFMSKFSWNILWEWKEKYVNPEAPRSLMLPLSLLRPLLTNMAAPDQEWPWKMAENNSVFPSHSRVTTKYLSSFIIDALQ